MTIAMGIAALVSLWLLGALILTAARIRPNDGVSAVVCDLVAGAVTVALFGTFVIVVGLQLSLIPLYVLMAAIGVLVWKRGASMRAAIQIPSTPLASLLLLVAALLIACILVSSLQDRLWWDGWSQWAFKARVLFIEGTLPRTFLDPQGLYARTNLDYPLGLPLAIWWLYQHAADPAPVLASFLGAVWFALLPLLVWGELRHRTDERIAAGAALGVAAFWPIAFFAAGGTPDVLVALALLGAVVEVERGIRDIDGAAFARGGIYLALGALAKNEGWALAVLALIAAGAGLLWRRSRQVKPLLGLLLPLVAVIPWMLFTRSLQVRSGIAGAAGESMLTGERLPHFLSGLGTLLTTSQWFPLPLLAGLGVLAAVRRREPGLSAAWLLLGGYFAAVCAAYVYTSAEMSWLLASSLHRVMAVLVPATVYLSQVGASQPATVFARGEVAVDPGAGRSSTIVP